MRKAQGARRKGRVFWVQRAAYRLGAALLTLGAACGGGGESSMVTRVDSAGVTLITYAGPDKALDWTFDSLYTLGGTDAGPQAFYELRGGVMGSDAAGELFVLDSDGHRIVTFDADGAFVREMGREGKGPGELAWPISLTVTPDGRAGAFDIGKMGLVWFGPGGEPLQEQPVPRYFGTGMAATESTLVYPSRERPSGPTGPTIELLVQAGAGDTATLVSLVRPDDKIATFTSCGMSASMPPIFAPTVRWAATGDRVAATTAVGYEVRLLVGARLAAILRRPLEAEPASEAAARATLGAGMKFQTSGGTVTCDPTETVQQRGFADHIPLIISIAAGPDGTWWVHRHAGSDEARFDVWSAEGSYIGTLPASDPYPMVVVSQDRFGTVVTDQLDVDRLVVYRLSRPERP